MLRHISHRDIEIFTTENCLTGGPARHMPHQLRPQSCRSAHQGVPSRRLGVTVCPVFRQGHRHVARAERCRRARVQAAGIQGVGQNQQGNLIEPAAATKVRVERQTHLPASREEAWGALRRLVSQDDWKELSAVFAALESIYRYVSLATVGYISRFSLTSVAPDESRPGTPKLQWQA